MKSNHNKTISPELRDKLSKIKRLALDMDGTIYLGSTLFPFTIDFLDSMKNAGVGYSFLTNNPTKSVADYLKKLATSEPASNSSCAATTSSEPEKSASDGIMYGISRTWLIGSVV